MTCDCKWFFILWHTIQSICIYTWKVNKLLCIFLLTSSISFLSLCIRTLALKFKAVLQRKTRRAKYAMLWNFSCLLSALKGSQPSWEMSRAHFAADSSGWALCVSEEMHHQPLLRDSAPECAHPRWDQQQYRPRLARPARRLLLPSRCKGNAAQRWQVPIHMAIQALVWSCGTAGCSTRSTQRQMQKRNNILALQSSFLASLNRSGRYALKPQPGSWSWECCGVWGCVCNKWQV